MTLRLLPVGAHTGFLGALCVPDDLYWVCRTHMSDSPFFRIGIEKAAGVKTTVRSVTTIAKLAEKYPARGQPTDGGRRKPPAKQRKAK